MSDHARILHAYKLRLTNLAQSNRSLKLGRLSVRRDVDLLDLGFVEDTSAEDLLTRILAGKPVTLLHQTDPRHDKANRTDRRLGQLYRELALIEEESGAYDLHVGYPFCEGRFLDGTVVRAPVLLFPVRLVRDLGGRPRWQLQPLKDEGIQLNRTFFMAWELYQQVRLPADFWDEEIPYSTNWGLWLAEFYEKLKIAGLAVNFNTELFEQKLLPFPDFLKATFDQFSIGRLTFRSQAVLGMFPQSDSALHDDYEALEAHPESWELEKIFAPGLTLPPLSYTREEHRYFVTDVDQSQEEALLAARSGASLVVHGPPGTGKSQVIVNLIANALAHRKTVLVVSHKRAALEVVWRRLQQLELGAFAMQVYDVRHDRRAVFDALRRTIEEVETFRHDVIAWEDNTRELAYLRACREADQSDAYFEELFQALSQRQPSGFSAHELYERLIELKQASPQREAGGVGSAISMASPRQPRAVTLSTAEGGAGLPLEYRISLSADVALAITAPEIAALRQSVATLADYADLLDPAHPWAARHSQAAVTPDERLAMQARLEELPAELSRLAGLMEPLREPLGSQVFDAGLLMRLDHAFSQALVKAADPEDWEGMALLAKDRTKLSTHQAWMAKAAKAVSDLATHKILTSSAFSHIPEVTAALHTWRAKKDDWFPWLDSDWRAAKATLRSWLDQTHTPWSDEAAEALGKGVLAWQHLAGLLAEVQQKPAFGDFPLTAPVEAMRAWLSDRARWLHAWEYLQTQVIPLVPAWKDTFIPSRLAREAQNFLINTLQTLSRWRISWREWRDAWLPYLHENQVERLQDGLLLPTFRDNLKKVTIGPLNPYPRPLPRGRGANVYALCRAFVRVFAEKSRPKGAKKAPKGLSPSLGKGWVGVSARNRQNPHKISRTGGREVTLAAFYARDFRDMQALDRLWQQLSPTFAAIAADLSRQHAWLQPDGLADRVEAAVLIHHIGRVEHLLPVLGDVSTRGFARKREAFAEQLRKARSHAAFLVQRRVKEHLLDEVTYNRLGNPVTYRKLLHEVSKKRQLWTLRRLFSETWRDGLDRLAPVWLTTPEVAASIFPLEPDLFDLVLVDEASQCFVERAVPILLRGSQHIIAGDDKQLQPSSLYAVRYEDEGEEAELSGGTQLALEVESVLDLARRTLPEHRLLWHYRSAHEALIRFSNGHFYDHRLMMVPSPQAPALPPLKWVQADGTWEGQANAAEARLVVDEVLHYLQQPDAPSLGIVTFNQPQQALIGDLLDQTLLALQQDGDPRWEALNARLNPALAEPLFVKNIENVQGDERDIILFSIGYAPNRLGTFSAQFGLLNRAGGENRLNVAVTRARRQVCVVCSFAPSALEVSDAKHPGPGLLKAYLQYVYDWTQQGETKFVPSAQLRPALEAEAERLRSAGFALRIPLGTTGYRVDMGAIHPETGEAQAIEAEGGGYFGGRSAREREVYRPALLEAKGWHYRRLWLRDEWMGKS